MSGMLEFDIDNTPGEITLEEAEQLLHAWQKVLGLENWKIALRIDKNLGSRGCYEASSVHRAALIKLSGLEPDTEYVTKYIPEVTLIHELLHIKHAVIEDTMTKLGYQLWHTELEHMAEVLYSMRRLMNIDALTSINVNDNVVNHDTMKAAIIE